ncbi:MAG TPA: glycosyltransferase [Anaerolineae bacterium]|nr:glycosyltransferase [Anaerolineae bacterium]
MNILYICADKGIPIRGHKGAAVHVRAMSNAFARAGHTVTILTPRPGPADGPAPQAEIIHVPRPDGDERAYADLLFQTALEWVENGRFHMIYERYSLWSDAGARLARETRLPLVLEVNAPLLEEAARYRDLTDYEQAAAVETAQFQAARAISVVSRQLRDYVIKRGAAPQAVHVLPNGIDPALFHPAVSGGKVRDRLGLKEKIVVGFVGRARSWHDLPTLLEAVARLRRTEPRYHLLLVGQMPDDLDEQLRERSLARAVTVAGPVPHQEAPGYMAALDVAVSSHLPLPDFYFSPLKLFEYLACGVPTVAANVGQPAQIIQDGETALLYRPGDAASLADCIASLMADRREARRMAWRGAALTLQSFTWDKNAETVAGWVDDSPAAVSLAAAKAACAAPILDDRLHRRLYMAMRPDLAGPLLARHLPVFQRDGPARFKRVGRIRVLKYKPGRRCVLLYELYGRSRKDNCPVRYQVVGKLFRDERGRRLHKLQRMLWRNGFGPEASGGVYVPNSLAYIPKMRLQAQAYAPGQTLDELAETRNIGPLIPQAAYGLAKLHNLPAPLPANGDGPVEMRSYFLDDELANLEQFTEKLAQARPEDMPRILLLRDALFAWADELPPLDTAVHVHRDFYYSQLLFNLGELTLIDFDLLAYGDPAIDAANFTAHLYLLGLEKKGDLHALAFEAEIFMLAYARLRPLDSGFWARFAFYQAATFYRLLRVAAFRPQWAGYFEPLLRHTAVCLERREDFAL